MAVVPPGYANVVIGGSGGGGGTISISGAHGHVYTSSGTGATWASTAAAQTTAHGKLKVEGKDADIYINGQSLSDWMSAVDRRLTILRPNTELQKKYSALQEAYNHYKTLESLLYEQE
jgi:hypothetical protein